MKKFEASTKDLSLPQNISSQDKDGCSVELKPKLQLIKPKDPKSIDLHKLCFVKVKSCLELKNEPMAKMSNFKGCPSTKKELYMENAKRVNNNAEVSYLLSTKNVNQKTQFKPKELTKSKPPILQTSLRIRSHSLKVKSSNEIEQEELEKTLKKLSLDFAPNFPRYTKPDPFYLLTEERGAEKERKFTTKLMQEKLEAEKARVPKANPIPYTTDVLMNPPKIDHKECTQPEPFQLKSLIRHENEMRREMEERRIMEREEARIRIFKAQPILKEDPIPLPEKEPLPVIQTQEFTLHAQLRAVDRAEFKKKIKEKEAMYKRYKEEIEAKIQMEEEMALKLLRRTLVLQARPVPKFANPFVPKKSCKDPTKPKSPKLRVLERMERKEMTDAKIPQSTTTSLMR